MSFADKAKNKGQEMAGKAKEAAGDATGNRNLEAEGQEEEGRAKAKQAGENLKDAAKDAREGLDDRR